MSCQVTFKDANIPFSEKSRQLRELFDLLYDCGVNDPVSVDLLTSSTCLKQRCETCDEFGQLALPCVEGYSQDENIILYLLQMTVLSVIAEKAETIPVYKEAIENLVSCDTTLLCLLDFLLAENPYVSYAAMKCLLSLVMVPYEDEPPHWQLVLIQDVISKVSTPFCSYSHINIAFTFTRLLLSKCKLASLKIHTLVTIVSCWRFYFAVAMDIAYENRSRFLMDICIPRADNIITFLRLWKRTLKTKQALDLPDAEGKPQNHVPTVIYNDMFHLANRLLDLVILAKKSAIIQALALDILNLILVYREGSKREEEHILKLAEGVLNYINDDFYDYFDYYRLINFGWSKNPLHLVNTYNVRTIDKNIHCNKMLLRKSVLLTTNACVKLLDDSSNAMSDIIDALEIASSQGNKFYELEGYHNIGQFFWAKKVFNEQDDDYTRLLLDLLCVAVDQREMNLENHVNKRLIDIHMIFRDFCETIYYDRSVVLDLLVSPETCFLEFFTLYLKFLIADWEHLVAEQKKIMISRPSYAAKAAAAETLGGEYYFMGGSTERLAKLESLGSEVGAVPSKFGVEFDLDSDATTTPSISTSGISYQTQNDISLTKFVLPSPADIVDMFYMFAQLMSSMQKMQRARLNPFNFSPLIKLLYYIQRMEPHVMKGYFKLRI